MNINISSWYKQQIEEPRLNPKRRFLLGGSDYSAHVIRWPVIRYRADTIDLGTTSLLLSNNERAFGFLLDDEANLNTLAEVALGLTHPASGDEWLSLYQGVPSHLNFEQQGLRLRLQLQGKTKRLTDAALGTDTQSDQLSFTGSSYYPSDLAWTLMTSHGDLSTIQDSSNPDIQYDEWLAWRTDNKIKDVRVQANFGGEKVYQALNTLSLMDSRVITIQNGKLRFNDVYQPESNSAYPIDPGLLLGLKVQLSPDSIVNHYFVEAGYNPGTSGFSTYYSTLNSESILKHGKKSGRFSSRQLWFPGTKDAQFLAESEVFFKNHPRTKVQIRTPLAGGIHLIVGDSISLTHSPTGFNDKLLRIQEMSVDLNAGLLDFRLEDAKNHDWQYQSTVSSVMLFFRSLTAVGSNGFLAVEEEVSPKKVYQTDSAGFFQVTSHYADALFALSQNEILLGGQTNTSSSIAWISRSSDAGVTASVVASLAPLQHVVNFFQVKSGTLLASTNSGGIYRSVDAGSSWLLTQTISGHFQADRFFMPTSGVIWAGVGNGGLQITNGLYLWASSDEGQNWASAYTLQTSYIFNMQGFFPLSNSEFLLGHTGPGYSQNGIMRGTHIDANSITLATVMHGVTFSAMFKTSSGHLLLGHNEDYSTQGGGVYRSVDNGSSWVLDEKLTKRGAVHLVETQSGTMEAYVSHTTVGNVSLRFNNIRPNKLN